MTVEVENLAITLGDYNLRVPTLRLEQGTVTAITGPNGAGKTVFLRLLSGLLVPDAGRVLIDNISIAEDESWKKKSGIYIDDTMLIDFFSPEEYLRFRSLFYSLPTDKIGMYIKGLKDEYGDTTFEQKDYLVDCSMGIRKRVGILSTFISNPMLVIVDEPFENLDKNARDMLRHFFVNLRKNGALIIFTVQRTDEITTIADTIYDVADINKA